MEQTEDNLFRITIKIAERGYKLNVSRKQEELYRNAAKYVDSKLSKFINKHSQQDMETYLSLTALELAVELLNKEEDWNDMKKGLEGLDDELANCLKK